MPESENLRKGGIPKEDGNRRACNEVGEAIAGLPQWICTNLHPDISPIPVSLL